MPTSRARKRRGSLGAGNEQQQQTAAEADDADGDAIMNDACATKSDDPTQPSPSKRAKHQRRTRSTRPNHPEKPKAPPRLRVNIKRFHGVARWSWNVGGSAIRAANGEADEEEDVCGICQNPFEGVAPGMKYPGDDCPLERGPCNHCFHLQCVNKWLNTKKSCPICRADWPT